MWSYLSQFWNSITEVIVSGGTYTVEWFQNIGNSVAGAIGGVFDYIVHYINDSFIFLGWLFSIIKALVNVFVLPISYIFNFIKAFLSSAFKSPITPESSYTFTGDILSVFSAIPSWSVLTYIVGVLILLVAGFAILKLFTKISSN